MKGIIVKSLLLSLIFLLVAQPVFAWVNVQVSANPTMIPADGISTSDITATVKKPDGSPWVGHIVEFSISPQIGTINPQFTTTDSMGEAKTTYTSGTSYATITVTATDTSTQPNVSGNCNITIDPTEPTTPVVTDDGEYTTLTDRLHATWTPCTDPETGIKEYQYAVGTTEGGTDIVPWTPNGLSTEATPSGLNLIEGQKYYFSVAAINNANKSSLGYSDGITVDPTAPSGTIVINDGAPYTNSAQVTLTLSATDSVSGRDKMQFSNTNNGTDWSNPESYNTTKQPWELLSGDGTKTVYVSFSDVAGNWSNSVSDTIILNTSGLLLIDITSHETNDRVNTSTITVSGTVSDSTATVTVNNFSAVVDGNTFTAPNIPLTEGTNIITARAVKDTQTATDTINVILDLDPPSINIYTPDANSTTRSNIVYGRVSDDTKTVTVNSTPAELLADFRFIARPTLTEGANTITVQAQDKAGNTNSSSINITYNTTTPKVTITSPLDNSEINTSPIKVDGANTSDIQFILVEASTAIINNTTFTAEGITLDPIKTVITSSGYDANNSIFQDAILINSPNLSSYELQKVSGDVTEDDPNRPQAGSNQILKVKLEKNSLPAVNEEIQFSVTQGTGTLSQPSAFTDINGEAQVILTTDTNSDITNQVECFPTNNPLVKTTFYIDTKPALPSILTKITDDSITPVPGATIPLIVKLTDSNNNPIPDETINFQITQGTGTLSSPTATTNYYGEAKTDLTLSNTENTSTQITVSSSTNPNLSVIFTITTSIQSTLTFDDIMAKVRENENKIQDFMADVVKISNAPYFTPQKQFKIWSKGNKSKIQVLLPVQRTTIVETTADSITVNGTPFFTIEKNIQDPDIATADLIESFSGDIYVLKTIVTSTNGFEETTRRYIDYSKGTLTKTEREYRDPYHKKHYEVTYSYILIADTWVMNQMTIIDKDLLENKEYTTTETRSNIIINSGIPDSVFQ